MHHSLSRRTFAERLGALAALISLNPRSAWGAASVGSRPPDAEAISRDAETIHQVVMFKATPERVYQALVDAREFAAMTHAPAAISGADGGAFSLFGGLITGRHIQLVPHRRIVQAWRSEGWPPGIYSVARFALEPQGAGTQVVFDHTGFPRGQAEHLLTGWKDHYWANLNSYLT